MPKNTRVMVCGNARLMLSGAFGRTCRRVSNEIYTRTLLYTCVYTYKHCLLRRLILYTCMRGQGNL